MQITPDSRQDQIAIPSPEGDVQKAKNIKLVTARINRFKIFYFFLLMAITSSIGALTFEFLARLPHLPMAFLNVELLVIFIIMQILAVGAWWFRRSRIAKKLHAAIGRNDGKVIFRFLLRREFSNLSACCGPIMFFMGGFLVLTWNGLVRDARITPAVTAAISPPAGSALCSPTDGRMPQLAGPPVGGKINGLISPAMARQMIPESENRIGVLIDPAYISNQRVAVQTADGREVYILVPQGERVHLGEAVAFIPGHLEPPDDCFYTPNLMTR